MDTAPGLILTGSLQVKNQRRLKRPRAAEAIIRCGSAATLLERHRAAVSGANSERMDCEQRGTDVVTTNPMIRGYSGLSPLLPLPRFWRWEIGRREAYLRKFQK